MRRSGGGVAALVAVLVSLLAVLAPPAQAGALAWEDTKGDATGWTAQEVEALESTPRPSDPELDLLFTSWATSGDTIVIVIRLDKLAQPQASQGATYTANFNYDESPYSFRYQNPADVSVSARGLFFRAGTTTIPCARCSAKLDGKTNTVTITAALSSMTAGMKSNNPSTPPIGKGSKFTKLQAKTYRSLAAQAFGADISRAKADAEVVI